VELDVAYNAGLHPCGTAGTPAAKLRLAWDEFTLTGGTVTTTPVVVGYVVEATGTGRELHRVRCQTDPVTHAVTVTDIVVAHQLGAGDPSVTCSSTCTAAPAPQQITLSIPLTDPGGSGGYTVVLSGQRRQT
jgi:hypothetical protein